MEETEIHIKNMVCPRCVMAVEERLKKAGLHPLSVELGKAVVEGVPSPSTMQALRKELEAIGFSIIDERDTRIVEEIKRALIALVNGDLTQRKLKLSNYLADVCHSDYSTLSKLFSEVNCITIEKYYLTQKIEKVKELLMYNELTLSEIAYKLDYSSTAHLSVQFKSITGMTPTQFKQSKHNLRKSIDQL